MMHRDYPHLGRPLVAWHSFDFAVPLCLDPILHLPVGDCLITEGKPVALLMLLVRHNPVIILSDHVIHLFPLTALQTPAWHVSAGKVPRDKLIQCLHCRDRMLDQYSLTCQWYLRCCGHIAL